MNSQPVPARTHVNAATQPYEEFSFDDLLAGFTEDVNPDVTANETKNENVSGPAARAEPKPQRPAGQRPAEQRPAKQRPAEQGTAEQPPAKKKSSPARKPVPSVPENRATRPAAPRFADLLNRGSSEAVKIAGLVVVAAVSLGLVAVALTQ